MSGWRTKGNWRVESFAEDDGVRVMVVHYPGDNKMDVWEYAAAKAIPAGYAKAVPISTAPKNGYSFPITLSIGSSVARK